MFFFDGESTKIRLFPGLCRTSPTRIWGRVGRLCICPTWISRSQSSSYAKRFGLLYYIIYFVILGFKRLKTRKNARNCAIVIPNKNYRRGCTPSPEEGTIPSPSAPAAFVTTLSYTLLVSDLPLLLW